MIGDTFRLPARVALLIGICFIFGVDTVSAQSGDTTGPTSGRIVLIEPREPKGVLQVKQGKHLHPINAVEGMLVRRGYLLILSPAARATVLCGDGRKRELAPGPQGCPCIRPCTPEVCGINYEGSTIGSTRGLNNDAGLFPVVISPRKTLLRNLRPTIRWGPPPGAKENDTYTVTLYGEGMKPIWTKEVGSQTSCDYPEKEPSLTPGQTYKVVVTSGVLSSDQDHSPGLGFTTLTAEQARVLNGEEAKRRELQLPEPQTRFLIANLYAASELYYEAIEQLQDLYTTMKEPAVARMLGDLYATVGLNREAEKAYLEALSLTPASDLDGVGLIQSNLAQVYENLGIFDRAITRLAEAIKAYRRLKNTSRVKALLLEQRRLKGAGRRR